MKIKALLLIKTLDQIEKNVVPHSADTQLFYNMHLSTRDTLIKTIICEFVRESNRNCLVRIRREV